jgi:DNA polymerase-3 subunit delta
MPPAPPNRFNPPVLLVWGEDDFAVKQRTRQLYQQWCAEAGGMDHEIIDAGAASSSEALRAMGKLREALQTLPFFGAAKVVWFQNCSFLGEERAAASPAVTERLNELAQELAALPWDNVRLLLNAALVDRRRTFYRAIEKLGVVENVAGLSADDKHWAEQAEVCVRQELRARQKEISEEALGEFVSRVGPNLGQLHSELEKLAVYAGNRPELTFADVAAVVTRQKQARAFALGDALGDRDLARVLRTLDEELWEMKFDRERTPVGLLFGLISKVRVLLLAKELLGAGLLKAEANYQRFRAQLERLPPTTLPEDKRYNPLAMNPYILFRALPQAANYTTEELVRAMDLLLTCNQRLVTTGADEARLLQQTLVQIAGQFEKRIRGIA